MLSVRNCRTESEKTCCSSSVMICPTPGNVTVIGIDDMLTKNRVGADDGSLDGKDDGENVVVGRKLGLADIDGTEDGIAEGTADGAVLGLLEGLGLGAGLLVGPDDRSVDGKDDGENVGLLVGPDDGSADGKDDGEDVLVGRKLGLVDVDGTEDGIADVDGTEDGRAEGVLEGLGLGAGLSVGRVVTVIDGDCDGRSVGRSVAVGAALGAVGREEGLGLGAGDSVGAIPTHGLDRSTIITLRRADFVVIAFVLLSLHFFNKLV